MSGDADAVDQDSDNDSLPDRRERSGDLNGNGISDYLKSKWVDNSDDDKDGIPNRIEILLGTVCIS